MDLDDDAARCRDETKWNTQLDTYDLVSLASATIYGLMRGEQWDINGLERWINDWPKRWTIGP